MRELLEMLRQLPQAVQEHGGVRAQAAQAGQGTLDFLRNYIMLWHALAGSQLGMGPRPQRMQGAFPDLLASLIRRPLEFEQTRQQGLRSFPGMI